MGFTLAFAYALPPKVMDISYKNIPGPNPLPTREARKIEILSSDPVLHGGMTLNREHTRLWILNGEGSHITEIPVREYMSTPSGRTELTASRATREKIFRSRKESGVFSIDDRRLHYNPEQNPEGALWEIDLGFEPFGMASAGANGSITGWSAYPARLFVFPPERKFFYRVEWTPDAEPVSFEPCDARRSLLMENLSSGLSRLVTFDKMVLHDATLFDFSDGKHQSDVTAVAALSCDDFFVAGSFGVERVQLKVQP